MGEHSPMFKLMINGNTVLEEEMVKCPYTVKRYVNNVLISESELRHHTIENAVITQTVDNAITKNNIRYSQNAG